jgi:hypothetical protein
MIARNLHDELEVIASEELRGVLDSWGEWDVKQERQLVAYLYKELRPLGMLSNEKAREAGHSLAKERAEARRLLARLDPYEGETSGDHPEVRERGSRPAPLMSHREREEPAMAATTTERKHPKPRQELLQRAGLSRQSELTPEQAKRADSKRARQLRSQGRLAEFIMQGEQTGRSGGSKRTGMQPPPNADAKLDQSAKADLRKRMKALHEELTKTLEGVPAGAVRTGLLRTDQGVRQTIKAL